MRVLAAAALAAMALTGNAAHAQQNPQAEAQALDLLKRGIAFRTVAGPGNQTPEYAAYLRDQLVAGGFDAADIRIEKVGDTAWMAVRYPGTNKAAKPIYISGHMDVVEAKAEDWTRDPFTPVVENGYIFGRGATDMKYDLSTMVATLIQLKREGYKPARDILLLASGDEETSMKTTMLMAEQYHDAELLLNVDGGGGGLDENGKPEIFGLQGAEKTYADYELTFTNPGGHSSAPSKHNAIYSLAQALLRIQAYEFPGEINDITRAGFIQGARTADAQMAAAMRAFLANQQDAKALATLRSEPGLIGQTGTTCVATMVTAGHATNALPQRATANINCRIFPGTSVESVAATLTRVIADPELKLKTLDSGTVASPASPLRPDLMKLVSDGIHVRFPGVPIVPAMSAGASDSMWFRARGVSSYGVSPIFMKGSDSFAHGLNERTPLSEIAPSIVYYKSLLKGLTK
jgi:carboxypeptidase PM20D1